MLHKNKVNDKKDSFLIKLSFSVCLRKNIYCNIKNSYIDLKIKIIFNIYIIII